MTSFKSVISIAIVVIFFVIRVVDNISPTFIKNIKKGQGSESQIVSAESAIFGKAKFWITWGSDKILDLTLLNPTWGGPLPDLRRDPLP